MSSPYKNRCYSLTDREDDCLKTLAKAYGLSGASRMIGKLVQDHLDKTSTQRKLARHLENIAPLNQPIAK